MKLLKFEISVSLLKHYEDIFLHDSLLKLFRTFSENLFFSNNTFNNNTLKSKVVWY